MTQKVLERKREREAGKWTICLDNGEVEWQKMHASCKKVKRRNIDKNGQKEKKNGKDKFCSIKEEKYALMGMHVRSQGLKGSKRLCQISMMLNMGIMTSWKGISRNGFLGYLAAISLSL